ncbi:MAG: transposase family protein [Gloeomargarita sp. HHBFW_bins_162]
MRYEELAQLSPSEFKRLCGVTFATFHLMLSVGKDAVRQRPKVGGPCQLSWADQLLLTLPYWREYRTYFHMAQDWGIHENSA